MSTSSSAQPESHPRTPPPDRTDGGLPRTERIVWLFNSVGTDDNLLYWNEILATYLERYPRSEFFTATPPTKKIPGTDKQVHYAGCCRIPLGSRRNSYPRRIDIASPGVFRRLLRDPPDVIVVFEFLAYAAYLALMRRWFPQTRILLLLESDPVRGQIGRNRGWKHWLRARIAPSVDQFLTNNSAGERYLREQLGVAASRILTRPFLVSVPPAQFTQDRAPGSAKLAPQNETSEIVRFLAVGQLIERKGMRELIRAVGMLPIPYRARMQLDIVGDGILRQELHALIESLGLSSQVRLLGSQSYATVSECYAAADVFVMPTLDDYRALVGFEALGYGLPMLHSCLDGAVHEVIQAEPQRNGIAFDPRDLADFARGLQWMIDHPQERKQMGVVSRRMSAQYTVPFAVESLTQAIEQCLPCSHRG
jgi:glycosyltransferase involved in cell wall biosynthesis